LSPQTRRGRAVPPSHRKPSSHVVATPPEKTPAAGAADATATRQSAEAKAAPVRAGRRRGVGIGRVRKSSGIRYLGELFGAYTPILIGFFALFAGVWLWISFGPHAATPKENWSRIEAEWMPKREAANLAIAKAQGNFTAEIGAYQQYRAATSGWMDALNGVKDWDDSSKSKGENQAVSDDMSTFETTGANELNMLDSLIGAATQDDLVTMSSQVPQYEQAFNSALVKVRQDIMGNTGDKTTPAPLSVPSENPCASPAPSGSPGASGSPLVCPSSAPSGSAGPSGSPAPSPSAGPS
jgi:hypothetical protein